LNVFDSGSDPNLGRLSASSGTSHRVRSNSPREFSEGDVFLEADGFWVVSYCVPKPSVLGRWWDVHLRPATVEESLLYEVMES
jgi:hypothetical protein